MGLSLNEESESSEEKQNVLSKFRKEKLDSIVIIGNQKLKQKEIQTQTDESNMFSNTVTNTGQQSNVFGQNLTTQMYGLPTRTATRRFF